MRKLCGGALLLFALSIPFQSCRKGNTVERTIENGVEVVVNHLEPYKLPGVPSNLKLEEILSIDMEKDEIAKMGLASVETFTVDSAGSIYIMQRESSDKFIFKFDGAGKFLTSFGRKGQGPGEFDSGGDILIDGDNRVIAKDMTQDKFFAFSQEGVLLGETKSIQNFSLLKYLSNGKYLTWWQEMDPVNPLYRNHYCISNDTLAENHEFYIYEFPDGRRGPRYVPALARALIIGAAAKNIFVGDSRKGYEIGVFDFSGKLLRKIRKAYRPVAFPEDYKAMLRKVLARNPIGQDLLRKADYPANLPPFRFLFADDQGRLFVMTNEREGERMYWYDIFTAEGVFIGRFRLDNVQVIYSKGERYYDEPADVLVRGDRLYCLREKDSGFKMLTVYRMRWE